MLSERLPILYNNSPGINSFSLRDAFIGHPTFAMVVFALLKSQPSPCRLSCSSKTGDNAWASDATLCRAGSPQQRRINISLESQHFKRCSFMKNLPILVYIGRANQLGSSSSKFKPEAQRHVCCINDQRSIRERT